MRWDLSTHRNERITAWWARARDFDDVPSSIANAVAVTRTSGVQTSLVAEPGDESGVDASIRWGRSVRLGGRCRGGCGRCPTISTVLDGLLLSKEGGRGCWASNSRTTEILQGHERGLHTGEFLILRITCWERDRDARVVDCAPCCDVGFQRLVVQ